MPLTKQEVERTELVASLAHAMLEAMPVDELEIDDMVMAAALVLEATLAQEDADLRLAHFERVVSLVRSNLLKTLT